MEQAPLNTAEWHGGEGSPSRFAHGGLAAAAMVVLALMAAPSLGAAPSSLPPAAQGTPAPTMRLKPDVPVYGAWRYDSANQLSQAYTAARLYKDALRAQGLRRLRYKAIPDCRGFYANVFGRHGFVYLWAY